MADAAVDGLAARAAAVTIQRATRARKVARMAAILSRLPLDLKIKTIECVWAAQDEQRAAADRAIVNVVRARFSKCGVPTHGEELTPFEIMRKRAVSTFWRDANFDQHFEHLAGAFRLATRCLPLLPSDDIRSFIHAAVLHEHQCDGYSEKHIDAWARCLAAMRDFAAAILVTHFRVSPGMNSKSKHDCLSGHRVLESAALVTGA